VALSRLSGVVSDLQPSFVLSGQCVIVRLTNWWKRHKTDR